MGKYQGYKKYKDSGVEWLRKIPEHWKSLKIKRLTPIKRGASPRPIDDSKYFDEDGEYAWVRIADVTASERYLESTTQKLSELGKKFSVPLEPGQLFLSIAGSVGKPIITKIKCCIHDGFVYFPDLKINEEFIYYIFNSGQPYLGLGKLGTQLNLNTETVGGITIGFPPLDEQEKIARFLDYKTKQIDELIAKKETLIGKLDEKRTALISHAVTKGLDPSVPMKDSGIEWLGEIPEHWNIISIKRFSEIYDCKHKTVSFVDDGLPVASIAQVQNFYIDLSAAKQTTREEFLDMLEGGREPQNGDIIFSRNATVGASAIVRNDIFCMGQDVCLIRPIKTNSIFLNYNFRAFFIKSQINTYLLGSTFKRINVEEVKNLLICLPTLTEQEKIVTFLDQKTAEIDQQKAKIQKAIELLKEYRTALITNAVTGKIDVRQVLIP